MKLLKRSLFFALAFASVFVFSILINKDGALPPDARVKISTDGKKTKDASKEEFEKKNIFPESFQDHHKGQFEKSNSGC